MEQLKQRDKPPKTKRKFCPKSRHVLETLGQLLLLALVLTGLLNPTDITIGRQRNFTVSK
jgi:hypothetical protein